MENKVNRMQTINFMTQFYMRGGKCNSKNKEESRMVSFQLIQNTS